MNTGSNYIKFNEQKSIVKSSSKKFWVNAVICFG